MIPYWLAHIVLVVFNIINSRIDAYRILKHKSIAHGINFTVYTLIVTAIILAGDYDVKTSVLFCFAAFFNRQLSFDIALNIRRGLPWYYQSMANPPQAIMDRIERKLFGIDYDGKKIVLWYSIFYFMTFVFYYA